MILNGITQKISLVENFIKEQGSAVIGLSGGVDSTLVTRIAHAVLGDDVLAVIGASATLPQREMDEAIDLAKHIGVNYRIVETNETDDLKFKSNPSDRCYFCKTELYSKLQDIAQSEGFACVLDGTNADDLGDYRPGLRANKEQRVVSPLKEAGFTKDDIRSAAKQLGLPNWDKPAMPCLSSRFPYGQPIELKALTQVEKAEMYLRDLGFRNCRVRHYDKTAKIEVPVDDLAQLIANENRERITGRFREIGYIYVTVDLDGFASGNMNKVLKV
ncbi:MAG: ATP-dependent sacrificial sulfur transferase LarE [Calditrichaeota bacterium]|nr:MAG: ATP-dependent sacrificial sulfur transferase LarE [Calditrichota bacterium]